MNYFLSDITFQTDKIKYIDIINLNLYPEGNGEQRYDWFNTPNNSKAFLIYDGDTQTPIGTIGFHFRKFKTPLGIKTGAMAADFSVNKENRNLQGALHLINMAVTELLKRDDVDFIYTIPNKNSKLVIKRTGLFKSVGTFERHVKLLSFDEVLKDHMYWFLTPIIDGIWKFTNYIANFKHLSTTYSKFLNGLDKTWDSHSQDTTIMGIRDEKYLTWRYEDTYDINYKKYHFIYDNKHSFIIYKIIKNRAYVVDMLHPHDDDDMLVRMFASFENTMQEEHRSMIVIQSLGCDSVIATLKKLLWYRPYTNTDKELLVASNDDSLLQCLTESESYWFAGDEDDIQ